MYLSELQVKDVISTKDGRLLGKIIDVEINDEGKILKFIVEQKKSLRAFKSSNDEEISFSQIVKIGQDVILIDI